MAVKKFTELLPEAEPGSFVGVSFFGGTGVNVWAPANTLTQGRTELELRLQLRPDRPIVIGRQQGGEIEYLDPLYSPTPMVPTTSHTILTTREKDLAVSRGHFMLKSCPQGIVLVNGVPRRGGGLRPPRNGTLLLEPVLRRLAEEEEYVVERGASAKIRLPNGTMILFVPE